MSIKNNESKGYFQDVSGTDDFEPVRSVVNVVTSPHKFYYTEAASEDSPQEMVKTVYPVQRHASNEPSTVLS